MCYNYSRKAHIKVCIAAVINIIQNTEILTNFDNKTIFQCMKQKSWSQSLGFGCAPFALIDLAQIIHTENLNYPLIRSFSTGVLRKLDAAIRTLIFNFQRILNCNSIKIFNYFFAKPEL